MATPKDDQDDLQWLRDESQRAIAALPQGQAVWHVCEHCRQRECLAFHDGVEYPRVRETDEDLQRLDEMLRQKYGGE